MAFQEASFQIIGFQKALTVIYKIKTIKIGSMFHMFLEE